MEQKMVSHFTRAELEAYLLLNRHLAWHTGDVRDEAILDAADKIVELGERIRNERMLKKTIAVPRISRKGTIQ